jgi:alkylation response protein AidB-like acyl-CoA dehydrogenase
VSDLRELHDSARQMLRDQGLAADEATGWSLVAELGWLMVATPEEQGGLGMGLAGACALHRELGRALSRVPYLPAMLAIDAVGRSELPDRDSRLQGLMSGEEYIAAPLADPRLVLEGGDECRVSGSLPAVPSADRAGHVMVCAAAPQCVLLVPLAQPGVKVTARPTWDQTRRLFDVALDAVPVERELILASGDGAAALAARTAVVRDFALAAEAVGGAAALLELTVEYLQTRQQFGRPLAMFQALKHRCADLQALTEAAEALLLDGLARGGELQALDAADRAGRGAKQLACAAYAAVAEEALQLHGGIGMTSEHVCHMFLKRALLNEHLGREAARYDRALGAELLDNATTD